MNNVDISNTTTSYLNVIKDARMDKFAAFIGLKSKTACEEVDRQLERWQTFDSLKRMSARNSILKQQLFSTSGSNSADKAELAAIFDQLAEKEKDIHSILTPSTDLEKESFSQLFFTSSHFNFLNTIPHLLTIWWFMRMYAFPTISFLMPIFAVIGPYIFSKYIMKVPVDFDRYIKIIFKMYVGQVAGQNFIDQIKLWVQTCVVIISVIQSMWQPITNAIHLNKIKNIVITRATNIKEYVRLYEKLRSLWKLPRNPIPADICVDEKRLIAFCMDNPVILRLLMKWVARAEIAFRIAVHPNISSVKWSEEKKFKVINTCDIGIDITKQKPFNIIFENKTHALLTGPNRGGKSTVLRSVLRSILLAHTFGITISTSTTMSYFNWIHSCLRLEDLPGTASLFEREVTFASESLIKSGCGFILIDELFHSTNPSDAIMASNIYLKQLWNNPVNFSIISTHVFKLVDEAPDNIERLCCPAHDLGNGNIEYLYGLEKGVCKVSSVIDILKERKLVRE